MRTRLAPHVAAWLQNLGPRGTWSSALARPAGPIPYPDAPTVQIQLSNGSWLDISTDTRFDPGMTIRRGRGANDSRARTGSATLKINNLDGKYSPRNVFGPLYGLIARNTPLIITRLGTIRFYGEVPEWPPSWTTGGKDAWVLLNVAGPLRRFLAPNAQNLQSALRKAISASTVQPTASWSLEDGATAVTPISSIAGGAAMATSGGIIKFATSTGLVSSNPLPDFSAAGKLYGAVTPTVSGATSFRFEFAAKWSQISSGSTSAIQLTTDGNVYAWEIDHDTNGIFFKVTYASGATGGPYTSTIRFDDGAWHWISLEVSNSGADIGAVLYVDGLAIVITTVTGANVGVGQQFVLNPSGTINQGVPAMGHLTFWQPATLVNRSYMEDAFRGHAGETAGARLVRLCAENGMALTIIGDPADTTPMGPQSIAKFIDLVFDCEAADMGFLSEDRARLGLVYRTRVSMYNQAAVLALDYSASGNISDPLNPSDTDTRIINDSTITRVGGSAQRYALTSGKMSSANPPAGIGDYTESTTVNVNTDTQALDVAGWHVNIGTTDRQRYDQVSVNVANTITNHGLVLLARQMIAADTGDRISIDNPPVWAGNEQINLIVVGSTESFDQFRYTIVFDTVLQDPYVVGLVDDPVMGRFESDGTVVAAGIDAVTTTFQGLTATGELWVTAAYLAGLSPAESWINFDIMLDTGERLTVTDISGVTNPQTWTVIRAVNGVSKPIPGGAIISLRNPLRLAA